MEKEKNTTPTIEETEENIQVIDEGVAFGITEEEIEESEEIKEEE